MSHYSNHKLQRMGLLDVKTLSADEMQAIAFFINSAGAFFAYSGKEAVAEAIAAAGVHCVGEDQWKNILRQAPTFAKILKQAGNFEVLEPASIATMALRKGESKIDAERRAAVAMLRRRD